jgi:fructoselysine-6-P-deglycase FrlB-like protein
MEFDQLVDKARCSLLFTAPVLGPDLDRFFKENGDLIRGLAKKAVQEKPHHIYWVGSGNSWVNLYSGKYLLDHFTRFTSDCLTSHEFVTRDPVRLDRSSWTVLASFSGATEDTVAALRHANQKGSFTIALIDKVDSLMGQEADQVIAYNSKALYILPMAAAYLFSLEVARLQGAEGVEKIIAGLYDLPQILSRLYEDEEQKALKLAEDFAEERLFYVIGTGPLYGLAYKFGLTVFMENMRVHGSFIDAPEFRHGPVEMMERENPVMVILVGTDATRAMTERVIQVARQGAKQLIIYDLNDYPEIHPMLAPFVLMIPLQWFAIYSTLLRGIPDMDERVFMGRGIMGKGEGITWP